MRQGRPFVLGLREKIALAFGGLLLFFVAASVLDLRGQDAVVEAQAFRAHSYEVITRFESLTTELINQETAIRGYAITGRAEFLDPFRSGRGAFDRALAELLVLTTENIEQQTSLRLIRDGMAEWRRMVAEPIIDASASGHSVRLDEALHVQGKARVDALRAQIDGGLKIEREHLATHNAQLLDNNAQARRMTWLLLAGSALFVLIAIAIVSRRVTQPLLLLIDRMRRLAAGDELGASPSLERADEVGDVARALEVFRHQVGELRQVGRTKSTITEIVGSLQGARTLREFGDRLGTAIGSHLHSGWVLVFVSESGGVLRLAGGYAVPQATAAVAAGEGLVGECHRSGQPVTLTLDADDPTVPRVQAGGALVRPRELLLLPLASREGGLAVIEIALTETLPQESRSFLEQLAATAALNLESLLKSLDTQRLLEESQAQAEELQASEEALRSQREELAANNEILKDSSARLYEQGRQLRLSQDELRAQTQELKKANDSLREQSATVEKARSELQASNTVLERTSRYKSEFLANVSHELRTPLNSLLLLSRSLAENGTGNLNEEETESARIIHDGGGQLLKLINDILDLSKIEAGKMEALPEEFALGPLLAGLERSFRPVAQGRGIAFAVRRLESVPELWHGDAGKLVQVLNNLLGNAFKFTSRGEVTLVVEPASAQEMPLGAEGWVAFRVKDSGIGIAAEHLPRLFQAFEQAESGTSRRYGGTGLGLAISRQLAQLLGGDVRVESTAGQGSTFSLLLPVRSAAESSAADEAAPAAPAPEAPSPAEGDGVQPIREQRRRRLLLVEDDAATRHAVRQLLAQEHLDIVEAADATVGLEALRERRFHLVVLDLALPGMPGTAFLKEASLSTRLPPVVVYSAGEVDAAAALELRSYTDSIVIKGARSPERLLEEVRRLLRPSHESWSGSSAGRVLPPSATQGPASEATGRTVLVVDDDMRNIFAMSRALKARGFTVLIAQDAEQGIKVLGEHPEIAAVLMDIMMPGMDGNAAIARIRRNPRWDALPIVAVTAKAMRGDREQSLAAGATDYLSKPVDIDELVALLQRLWVAAEPAAAAAG